MAPTELIPTRRREAPEIHPRAIVDEKAKLAPGVVVGPGAVVEEGVELGPGVEVGANAVLTGDLTIGADTRIFPGAVLGSEPQDLAYDGAPSRVVIGERCTIRECVTIHRGTDEGTETVVGNEVFLMACAHLAHNCRVDDNAILANSVLLAGHVHVGPRAFIGGNAVVHQFCRIGELAIVSGRGGVGWDIPPYAMVVERSLIVGTNAVGLRRSGMSREAQLEIRKAYKLLYRDGLEPNAAIEAIREVATTPEAQKLVTFLESPSRRGLCRRTTKEDSARGGSRI